jgi:hypothetical protein
MGRSDKKLEAHYLSMQLHIKHIRAVEDSERVRAACLNYLQVGLLNFYPERMDIVIRVQQIAADLGGQLETPRLPWKYAYIQKVFGWTAAKRTQLYYNRYKFSMLKSWDKLLFRLKVGSKV